MSPVLVKLAQKLSKLLPTSKTPSKAASMARLSSWWVARKTNAAKGKQDACSEGTRSPCSSVGSAAELPFSVAPVQWPRNDPRLLVDSAAPHLDSWFEGYGWRVVGASTPCGVVHLGWLYSDGSTEFLALIARPATDGETVWSVGNPATAALAALLVASAGRT